MPTKKDDGKWYVNIRPAGRNGRQFKRVFDKKHEAIAFENWAIAEHSQLKPHEVATKQDRRRLSELIDTWLDVHGNTLRDIDRRLGKLNMIAAILGDPIAANISAKMWSDYRADRLKGIGFVTVDDRKGKIEQIQVKPVKSATVNRDHAYMCALFNELKSLGQWHGDNPLDSMRKLKEAEAELTYYNKEQLETLFYFLKESNSDHVPMVAKVCIAVGARWEEAETLSKAQVKNGRITFYKTKSGKPRTIPISPEFEKELLTHKPFSRNRLFSSCLSAFRRALTKSGLPSPKGQLTHVLRHSFAVRFMERGGNLVDLMNTLGHANIQTTAIYLRFSPTHLESVPKLTPLNELFK